MKGLARWRVPLGFLCAVVALIYATPSRMSWTAGALTALLGEALRIWAAGHIEKGREITRSGPYRFVRHPLYLGSTVLAVGFAIASRNLVVAGIAGLYLIITMTAAIRTEERELDRDFRGDYAEYRAGRMASVRRAFSWARVTANREHRAILGLAAVFAFLSLRIVG